jgi:hypothetical protein
VTTPLPCDLMGMKEGECVHVATLWSKDVVRLQERVFKYIDRMAK